MGVEFAASCSRSNPKKVRLHDELPGSQKLHADTGATGEGFALRGTDERPGGLRWAEKIENIQSIVLRQTSHDSDGDFPMRALDVAEKTNRYIHSAGDFSQRFPTLDSKPA